MALLLRRSDFSRCFDTLVLLGELREAFRLRPGKFEVARSDVGEVAVSAAVTGTLPSIPAFTVRVEARGPSGASGWVALHDARSGELLALIDAERLSALRDAVVGALAVETLARPDAERVALVGAGPHAGLTLKCLRLVRSLRQLRVYDPELTESHGLATRLYRELSLPSKSALTLEEAVSDAQIVVTTALADAPTYFPGTLVQGCHLNALGLGALHRRELSAGFLKQSRVYCDDRGALGDAAVPATELGEVLRGNAPGRSTEDEVTVFTSAGLPFEDLVVAWHLYAVAKDNPELPRVNLAE